MKLFLAILLAAFTAAPAAWSAQEKPANDPEAMQLKFETRRQQLEIEAKEAELDFQRQMNELELQQRQSDVRHRHRPFRGGKAIFFLLWLLVHALATVWLYKDLQQRKTGSGLWIPIVLIGGLLALLVYAVVRLGDMYQGKSQPQ